MQLYHIAGVIAASGVNGLDGLDVSGYAYLGCAVLEGSSHGTACVAAGGPEVTSVRHHAAPAYQLHRPCQDSHTVPASRNALPGGKLHMRHIPCS